MPTAELKRHYNKLCDDAKADLRSLETGASLTELAAWSHQFLRGVERIPLVSKVAGKGYFMFARPLSGKLKRSRPVNVALYGDLDAKSFLTLFAALAAPGGRPHDAEIALYTTAMSYFAASDLLNEADQKTPGTFFEILVGYIFAAKLQSTPVRPTTTQTIEGPLTLPTDYIFDLGANKPRIHLPVKTSTRERAVQVWAHQKLLDGMHGDGRFRGVLVCFGETNKQDNKSVVEVCVPQQWIAYQRYIARLHRIYYYDPPAKYLALRNYQPPMPVSDFASFFGEVDAISTF